MSGDRLQVLVWHGCTCLQSWNLRGQGRKILIQSQPGLHSKKMVGMGIRKNKRRWAHYKNRKSKDHGGLCTQKQMPKLSTKQPKLGESHGKHPGWRPQESPTLWDLDLRLPPSSEHCVMIKEASELGSHWQFQQLTQSKSPLPFPFVTHFPSTNQGEGNAQVFWWVQRWAFSTTVVFIPSKGHKLVSFLGHWRQMVGNHQTLPEGYWWQKAYGHMSTLSPTCLELSSHPRNKCLCLSVFLDSASGSLVNQ